MDKMKFDEWELLPIKTTDKIGKHVDALLKERLKEAVDEMFLQSWSPMYSAKNLQLLHWMHEICKQARIELRERKGKLMVVYDFVPDDFDEEFVVQISLQELAKEALDYYSDEDERETRKALAAELRKMADKLDA